LSDERNSTGEKRLDIMRLVKKDQSMGERREESRAERTVERRSDGQDRKLRLGSLY
jgi:hypothetical protein